VRICVASIFGEAAWFAHLLSAQGHDVSIAVSDDRYAEVLGGMVNVMPKEVAYTADQYDLVVFGETGSGKDADAARIETPTVGDSLLADRLEEDREFSLDFMQKCGITVAPWEAFDNPADAIRHIRKTKKRYVFKPIGEMDDKSTTYVSRSAEDLLHYFDVLFRSAKISKFVLQEYVAGTEVSTQAYINESGYYALNHTCETKKLMNGDVGPNTGCSGSLAWLCEDDVLFEKGLKKAIGPLQEMGYVGPIDLNTIVNAEGCWGLEFCPRLGYDSDALLTRLMGLNFGDFLHAIATDQRPAEIIPRHTFCASVRLSVPPYPVEGLSNKFYKAGIPIECLTEKNFDRFYVYDVRRRAEDADDLETAGICGWIGSPLAVGETIGQAFDVAYAMLKEVRVPNGQYRTDLAANTAKRYAELRSEGWLVRGS
jgi:phosphoribosylamine--glycine ligase